MNLIQFKDIPTFSKELTIYQFNPQTKKVYAPFFPSGVHAGFPSPAEDFIGEQLSLDERYITDPDSTYFVVLNGVSMAQTLLPNDLLIVKKGKELKDNDIGIFSYNYNEFNVRRIDLKNQLLIPDNKKYPTIQIKNEDNIILFGVIDTFIRDLKTK